MVVKCPNCGASLVYDIKQKKMVCEYCGSMLDEVKEPEGGHDTMVFDRYVCNCCGASLMLNENESTTFCIYCQQPTVIFDKVTKQKSPDYIIPFSVSRKEALDIIRKKIKRGFFVPKSFKNFKVEQLRGIYIPYNLVSMKYYDEQYWSAEVDVDDKTQEFKYERFVSQQFDKIPIDASKIFNNESSERLEPYDFSGLIPFKTMYLSGYNADVSDEDKEDIKKIAFERADKLIKEAVEKTLTEGSYKKLIKSSPNVDYKKVEYVLLPVWFLLIESDGQKYTLMVNGQTGKAVGSVPISKPKLYTVGTIVGFNVILVSIFAFGLLISLIGFVGCLIVLLLGVIAVTEEFKAFKDIKHSLELSQESNIMKLTVNHADMENVERYQH